MPVPAKPRIYHIVHVDRLPSIIADGCLWCDAEILRRSLSGTAIGIHSIKQRRLTNRLDSRPGLCVGECVPFYFCPRSVMLYVIFQKNNLELSYRGGQGSIVHLEADLRQAVAWADGDGRRWAFTLSNAGARYFQDRCDLAQLDEIDWNAVQARRWSGANVDLSVKEHKQAEFLMEGRFPWELVSRIGISSPPMYDRVNAALRTALHKPRLTIETDWYY